MSGQVIKLMQQIETDMLIRTAGTFLLIGMFLGIMLAEWAAKGSSGKLGDPNAKP